MIPQDIKPSWVRLKDNLERIGGNGVFSLTAIVIDGDYVGTIGGVKTANIEGWTVAGKQHTWWQPIRRLQSMIGTNKLLFIEISIIVKNGEPLAWSKPEVKGVTG